MKHRSETDGGVTQENLRSRLHYDPESGLFVRLSPDKFNKRRMGEVAGYIHHPKRYVEVRLGGYTFMAHRLAWFYMTGKWPADQIDHKDGNPTNNAFINLREATVNQNLVNRRKMKMKNPHLPKGVSPTRNRFRADLYLDGKRTYLGTFTTPEEAHSAFLSASRKVHGDFVRSA